MLYSENPKVALIIIGNEILSGRTLDKNTQYVAQKLGELGIELKQVRVIEDDEAEIISTLNLLRKKYDYVFTTGGIGPTHDDITTESVAKAFGVKAEQNPTAYHLLEEYYGGKDNFNPGRLKMTVIPVGAELIKNPVSVAPGFIMENVYVMAGVPKIMQAMLEDVLPKLRMGKQIASKTVQVKAGESKVAEVLRDLEAKNEGVQIGSYPYMVNDEYDHVGTNIVFRSIDGTKLQTAIKDFIKSLQSMKILYDEKK